ncbi:hypothetical protein OHS70_34120 [Streptomyces sp. NBC_00390]|uniref:hypothetical protein n=1 Tax=Streptomyces sp. NBC_00390 TaxID=2975736 RepID=UPI002E2097DE
MTDPHAEASVVPSSIDVVEDVALALELSQGRATGPAADALRTRLRSYITAFATPAQGFAESLDDSRARDIALNTIRHAKSVASDAVVDPAANLRLLAKAAEHTARYAAGFHHRQGGL